MLRRGGESGLLFPHERMGNFREMYAKRLNLYRRLGTQITTDGYSPEQVVDRVVEELRPDKTG